MVGRRQATELDAIARFRHLLLHMNREVVYYEAEIGTLLDLQQT